jgi:5,10-methylenetetrahydromethanopterin reductase
MTGRRRGVALTPMEVRGDVIVGAARLADELGYEVFSVAEGWGIDASVLLAEIAAATHRITLAAGVLSIWGRTPGTIAMTAASLHRLSGGRFILGLGASTRQLTEGFHGVPYARPAEKLRTVTRDVRALLAGDPARPADGSAARPIRLGQPAADVPIWVAATGDRSVQVAADLADGWYPIYLRRERCREWAAELAGGRPADQPLTVACGPFTVVDEDTATARAFAAACTARYLTAMGEHYPRLASAQGFSAEVELVRAENAGPAARRGIIPPEAEVLLEEFAAYGNAKQVGEQLDRWDETADITMIGLPPGLPWPTIEATLRAGAP